MVPETSKFTGLDPVKQPTEVIRGLWNVAAPPSGSENDKEVTIKDFGVQRFFTDLIQSGVEVIL